MDTILVCIGLAEATVNTLRRHFLTSPYGLHFFPDTASYEKAHLSALKEQRVLLFLGNTLAGDRLLIEKLLDHFPNGRIVLQSSSMGTQILASQYVSPMEAGFFWTKLATSVLGFRRPC